MHRLMARRIADWRSAQASGFPALFVPLLGHLVVLLLSMVVTLGFFVTWVVLIVKALQGERFELPVIGEFAEQISAAN